MCELHVKRVATKHFQFSLWRLDRTDLPTFPEVSNGGHETYLGWWNLSDVCHFWVEALRATERLTTSLSARMTGKAPDEAGGCFISLVNSLAEECSPVNLCEWARNNLVLRSWESDCLLRCCSPAHPNQHRGVARTETWEGILWTHSLPKERYCHSLFLW